MVYWIAPQSHEGPLVLAGGHVVREEPDHLVQAVALLAQVLSQGEQVLWMGRVSPWDASFRFQTVLKYEDTGWAIWLLADLGWVNFGLDVPPILLSCSLVFRQFCQTLICPSRIGQTEEDPKSNSTQSRGWFFKHSEFVSHHVSGKWRENMEPFITRYPILWLKLGVKQTKHV